MFKVSLLKESITPQSPAQTHTPMYYTHTILNVQNKTDLKCSVYFDKITKRVTFMFQSYETIQVNMASAFGKEVISLVLSFSSRKVDSTACSTV